ncbi:MAG: hypothetical protein KDA98_03820 [Acidimicrobiales bacterium]|nr:hypothetical protein [Acidimicrobiales bacterium]
MSADEPDVPHNDDAASAPTPAASGSGWKTWVAAGVVAAVVAGGAAILLGGGGSGTEQTSTAAAASADEGAAAEPGPGEFGAGPGTRGTVAANDGSTLEVEGVDGTASTVTTDDETTVVATLDGQLADLEVGDGVVVTASADDESVAERIVDRGDLELAGAGGPGGGGQPSEGFEPPEGGDFEPPEGVEPPEGLEPPADGEALPAGAMTIGTVSAVDGTSITVELDDGTTSVLTVTEATEVQVATEIAVADIEVGETVSVVGEQDDESIAASTIQVGDGGGFGFGGRPGGPAGATTD